MGFKSAGLNVQIGGDYKIFEFYEKRVAEKLLCVIGSLRWGHFFHRVQEGRDYGSMTSTKQKFSVLSFFWYSPCPQHYKFSVRELATG